MAESGPCDECVSKQDVQCEMFLQTRGMEMAVEARNQRVADLRASDHCLPACEAVIRELLVRSQGLLRDWLCSQGAAKVCDVFPHCPQYTQCFLAGRELRNVDLRKAGRSKDATPQEVSKGQDIGASTVVRTLELRSRLRPSMLESRDSFQSPRPCLLMPPRHLKSHAPFAVAGGPVAAPVQPPFPLPHGSLLQIFCRPSVACHGRASRRLPALHFFQLRRCSCHNRRVSRATISRATISRCRPSGRRVRTGGRRCARCATHAVFAAASLVTGFCLLSPGQAGGGSGLAAGAALDAHHTGAGGRHRRRPRPGHRQARRVRSL